MDKIKEKIKALLQKTEANGCTKQEAETALAKAAELMKKHMIEQHQLDENVDLRFIHKDINLWKFRHSNFLYVARYLAELFECEFYFQGRISSATTAIFFGTDIDVELCCYFWNMLQQTLFQDTLDYRKEIRGTLDPINNTMSISHRVTSFQQGWTLGILNRITQMITEKQAEVKKSTGTDLVVIKRDEVAEALDKLMGKPKTVHLDNDLQPYDHEGYNAGVKKAKEVDLTKPGNKLEEHNV